MDPDANLKEQRELAASIIKAYDDEQPVDEHDAARLAELVQALDEWNRKGGYLPRTWQRRS